MKQFTLNKHGLSLLTASTALITVLASTFISRCCADPVNQNASTILSDQLAGRVLIAGTPVSGSTVALYAAGEGAPTQLARGKTDADGAFKLDNIQSAKSGVLYLVAKGGEPKGAKAKGPNDAIALMTLPGNPVPQTVTVNELTTVASTFVAARFINGESISGNPLGLRIAAGNLPNLVNPVTGTPGKVLLDPINITQTTTLANLNTLGSLISACATVANDDWRARFLKAATRTGGPTPSNTLEAMAGIAREPWANASTLFGLFDEAYPQPKVGTRRSAPFAPYLRLVPSDFALSLCVAGGGMCANGKFVFDADGNLWSGQNWMPGSQSGVSLSIGGGLIKVLPNGTVVSPPVNGFRGMGLDGVGWGTGASLDKVWVGGLNGTILVTDFNGKPIGDESDFPMAGQIGGMMGIGVAGNGDVWMADGTKNHLLYFPGGRVKDGRIVEVAGLKSPFGIAIDDQNRVWVSNAQSDTVVRFPAADPSKTESFRCGMSVRGIALDSKGNLWAASNMSPDFPPPDIPTGVSIMKQFQIASEHMLKVLTSNPKMITGVLNMIRPDGTQAAPAGFTGNKAISVPWGVSIDGNDDVWVGNFWGRGVVLMAGDNTAGHPASTKTGDAIHQFQSGSIQMITDVAIDPAGNVWAANNWNQVDPVVSPDPSRPTSTWGGGSGLTVIYGVAAPVKPPLMGQVRSFKVQEAGLRP